MSRRHLSALLLTACLISGTAIGDAIVITHEPPTFMVAGTLTWSENGDASQTGIGADTAFERMKTLAGTWRGTAADGRAVTLEYKIGARGTTLFETQDPGTDEEMISVYSRDGAELVMTHYCPMGPVGNQPHMRLDRERSTTTALVFEFTGGSNLDAGRDTHVHAARITWLGSGRLKREWDIYQEGRKQAVAAFLVSRAVP